MYNSKDKLATGRSRGNHLSDKKNDFNMNSIKSRVRNLIAMAYYATDYYTSVHKGNIIILMYHRVLPADKANQAFIQPGMVVVDSVFDKQMGFLRNNYQMIPFSDLLDHWGKHNWNRNRQYCIVTFDDGWADNYRYAYPILKRYKIPATIFATTSYIGTHRWFWPEEIGYLLNELVRRSVWAKHTDALTNLFQQVGIKKDLLLNTIRTTRRFALREKISQIIEILKIHPEDKIRILVRNIQDLTRVKTACERLLLNWAEIAEMSNDGISFGPHTHNHRILTQLSKSELLSEVKESGQFLVKKGINYIPVFSYPNGDFDENVANLTQELGYKAAVTTRFGVVGHEKDNRFELNRIAVHNDVSYSIPLFASQLAGIPQRIREGKIVPSLKGLSKSRHDLMLNKYIGN